MEAIETVAPWQRLSRLWDVVPTRTLEAAGGGVSCALWRLDGRRDVCGDPDPHRDLISIGVAGSNRMAYWGDGRLRYREPLARGRFNIVRHGERPRAVLDADGSYSFLHVYVPHRVVAEAAASDGGVAGDVELVDPRCTPDPVADRLAQEVVGELRTERALSRLRLDVLALDLAVHLVRRHSSLSGTPRLGGEPARGGLGAWRMRRVRDFMEANLERDIGVGDLAGLVGLSPKHFARAFRETAGVPPHRYLVARRIERAKALLEGSLPIAEVALVCGFADQSHFTTMFRRATGATPAAWRSALRL